MDEKSIKILEAIEGLYFSGGELRTAIDRSPEEIEADLAIVDGIISEFEAGAADFDFDSKTFREIFG